MASFMGAEVAADAILIGRYFGRTAATSALSRATASTTASSAATRGVAGTTEGDGPGVRMTATSASSGAALPAGMSAAGTTGVGAVRFMSMFGGHRRAVDPLIAGAVNH
ncbi:hypothetical protein Agub_g12547 [Astrephomene gubernaculifera]|uniref:Uncharacterized protein n=1 Tax=Astrephomene gubernaculifera TaxID=47775 RepID=A0AAD3DYT8_9CHLO|nr:hypothetical protein Agub_g12547 [Astrephomene gubernaculifera]